MSSSVALLDSYSLFKLELNKIPVLSRDEEYKLAVDLRGNSNTDAAQKLIISQLKLVHYIAGKYYNFGLQKMDLIQEGVIGLMKAVKKFDPEKGFRLSTYASFWIKESIYNFVLNSWSIVKLGTDKLQRSIFSGLRDSRESIAAIDGHEVDSVAKSYGINTHEYKSKSNRILSKDTSFEVLSSEGFEIACQSPTPEDILEDKSELRMMKKSLNQALKSLPERDSYIFQARTLSECKKSLKELSVEFGISMERVRQIEKRATGKIISHIKDNI